MRWMMIALLMLTLPVMAEEDKNPVFGPVSVPALAKLPPKMADARRQAEPIVAALEKYEKEHGHPPVSLSSLIPEPFEFLPDSVPQASDWLYWNCERSWVLAVAFVDGGSLAYGARVLPSSIPGLGSLKVRLGQWGIYE